MIIQEKISLAEYTSWMVGGDADFFCLPQTIDELKKALLWAHQQQKEITLIGGGTNILVSDKGVRGLTICLRRFSGTEVKEQDGRLFVTALAGTAKSELLKIFLKYKLSPALFLAGLPGDVGGGIVMNAGVAEQISPREFVEITDWIEVLLFNGHDFVFKHFKKDELIWKYRHSHGWQPGIITRVGLSSALIETPGILDNVRAVNKVRLQKQPLDMPSCGSTFINPEGHKAAQLIDSCGLKGYTIGGAQVSMKHANFVVNLGNAIAKDMWDVIQKVKSEVLKKTGVELHTEVVLIGDWT